MRIIKNNISKFFISLLFISIPLIILISFYIIKDPFKVIYHYNKLYTKGKREISINRDYASTEIFLNNYKNFKYDSFIFGSSRSDAFRCIDYRKYVDGNIYHFDANGESLFGIIGKMQLIKNNSTNIKNCLIVLDSMILKQPNNSDNHIFIKSPKVSNESSIKFQFIFLKTFLNNKFFPNYILSIFNLSTPKYFNYPPIYDDRIIEYDSVTNDVYFISDDKELLENEEYYYEKNKQLFYKRDTMKIEYYPILIEGVQKKHLEDIKSLLDFFKTNYKIIIYPEYNQKYFNPNDIKTLESIFDKNNIYNYSGKNSYTMNIKNYYESTHCRYNLGKDIIKQIFTNVKQ